MRHSFKVNIYAKIGFNVSSWNVLLRLAFWSNVGRIVASLKIQ